MVALDSPGRETGIYISGGVMAAPTVGAVMADILPYLEVEKAEADVLCDMPDLTGMTRQEVLDTLSKTGLIPVFTGEEGTVTDQIPIASKEIARGSQVMVYLGDEIDPAQVLVPDFIGMTPEQAAEAAAEAGIYLPEKFRARKQSKFQYSSKPYGF